ncbi:hypothetical protein SH668x_000840 [Planctomicrobium sp. SH668]|uniref:hypothetical protein n=1 Tax=Planctomicrobium sp. SH668 TaxID=3448126 RepID=UPI003F5BBBE8
MKPFIMKPFIYVLASVLFVSSAAFVAPMAVASEQSAEVELSEQEQNFTEMMKSVLMTGRFSLDHQPDALPRSEAYKIDSVRKVKDDQWIVESRMKVGQVELPIPVPVRVKWAGDTPMIQVTDLTIPLVGQGFTARVLFFEGRYSGTWQHGDIGGHMWGTFEKSPASSETK